MSPEALKDKAAIKEVFAKLNKGEITYEEAQAQAKPIIDSINKRGREKTKELNKKFGMNRSYRPEDFINLRRSAESGMF